MPRTGATRRRVRRRFPPRVLRHEPRRRVRVGLEPGRPTRPASAAVVWSPNCVAVCRSTTSQAGRPSSAFLVPRRRGRSRSPATWRLRRRTPTPPRWTSPSPHMPASGSAAHHSMASNSRRASAALPAMAGHGRQPRPPEVFIIRPLSPLPRYASDSRTERCASPERLGSSPTGRRSSACHDSSNGTSSVSRRMRAIDGVRLRQRAGESVARMPAGTPAAAAGARLPRTVGESVALFAADSISSMRPRSPSPVTKTQIDSICATVVGGGTGEDGAGSVDRGPGVAAHQLDQCP